MISRLAICPEIFGKDCVVDVGTRIGAERILEGLLENLIAITDVADFRGRLLDEVSKLSITDGQQLGLLAAEVAKLGNRPYQKIFPAVVKTNMTDRLVEIHRARASDGVVCANSVDCASITSVNPVIDTLQLSRYPYSAIETRRKSWLSSQSLHDLTLNVSTGLLSRAFLNADCITIADKMFGRAAKDKVSNLLERFARGVVLLATAGANSSRGRTVRLISIAGGGGAAGGYIEPRKAEHNIRIAISKADSARVINRLEVILKQDSDPPVFRDRLVACNGRCWGVRHGTDDLGNLAAPPARRSPTFLDPDSYANRKLLTQIEALSIAN